LVDLGFVFSLPYLFGLGVAVSTARSPVCRVDRWDPERKRRMSNLKSDLIFFFTGIVFLLSMMGCYAISSPFGIGDMEEMKDTHDIYACGRLGGPPPTGLTEFIIVPKGSKPPAELPRC
jgi:hypothetical protein